MAGNIVYAIRNDCNVEKTPFSESSVCYLNNSYFWFEFLWLAICEVSASDAIIEFDIGCGMACVQNKRKIFNKLF